MFDVGQFIFVYYGSKKKLFAAKVIEEVTIKKLDKVEVDYTVMLKNNKDTTFTVKELKSIKDTEIFNTHEELKQFMVKKAQESIDTMISNCLLEKDKYWPQEKVIKETLENVPIVEEKQEKQSIQNKIEIQLENGQKANIIDNSGLLNDLVTESDQVQKKNENITA